jgi:hypothetical protein
MSSTIASGSSYEGTIKDIETTFSFVPDFAKSIHKD